MRPPRDTTTGPRGCLNERNEAKRIAVLSVTVCARDSGVAVPPLVKCCRRPSRQSGELALRNKSSQASRRWLYKELRESGVSGPRYPEFIVTPQRKNLVSWQDMRCSSCRVKDTLQARGLMENMQMCSSRLVCLGPWNSEPDKKKSNLHF